MEKWKEVNNIGILGFEFYFPCNYVSQKDLEQFDNLAKPGKYTEGFGQTEMAFCGENEDVCSLALTVTAALLEKYQLDQNDVGFLEVGTETLVDKSKSVKTVLMDLFSENKDLEGADLKNACFGGSQALFHAVDWIYSNYVFQGKLAIVVSVDIAVYAPGPARPTGGAGALAFLIGPNAPLVLERGLRSFFSHNVYDFYKPVGGQSSEYAIVNGTESIEIYLTAVDATYESLLIKAKQILKKDFSLHDFYAVLFHSPYSKLTQKALARLSFADFLHNRYTKDLKDLKTLSKFKTNKICDSWFRPNLQSNKNRRETFSKDFHTITSLSAQTIIQEKLNPYLEFCQRLGNMYTPSLYAQLIKFIHNHSNYEDLNDKRILLFSYGSGCIAAMFSIKCRIENDLQKLAFQKMHESASFAYKRLNERNKCSPEEFVAALKAREELVTKGLSYTAKLPSIIGKKNCNGFHYKDHSQGCEDNINETLDLPLFPGTFYLKKIDENFQRTYARLPAF